MEYGRYCVGVTSRGGRSFCYPRYRNRFFNEVAGGCILRTCPQLRHGCVRFSRVLIVSVVVRREIGVATCCNMN